MQRPRVEVFVAEYRNKVLVRQMDFMRSFRAGVVGDRSQRLASAEGEHLVARNRVALDRLDRNLARPSCVGDADLAAIDKDACVQS